MPRKKKTGRRSGATASRPDSPYAHGVPAPGVIVQVLEEQGMPLAFDPLASLLKVSGDKPRKALRRRLQQLVTSGRLLINRKAEYCLLEKIDAVTGTVSAHPDGFGFLIPDGGPPDVYLPYQEMRSLLNGDRVAVRVGGAARNGKRSGSLIEILERGQASIVGIYRREHGVGYVVESGRVPHHFLVPEHHRAGAKAGQMVKLEITEYPSAHREAQGKIVRVMGHINDPGMLTEVALEQFDIPTEWPGAVSGQAGAFGSEVAEADKEGRVDLRDTPLVTIDGEDARDFDDAVYAERKGEDWRLVVAIADVSHYVAIDSPLDKEANKRGTSVYFADRVVPMLPEALSNGLCSLNPEVDRLCMVCDMVVTPQGKVTGSHFYRAVMRSAARLTYTEVAVHLENKAKSSFKYIKQIIDLYEVYKSLEKDRERRGALELDLPEVRIVLGEDGQIEQIVPRHRNDAHRLIEECMIAANVEAAGFLGKRKLPTLFRVHDGPDPDRFEVLRLTLQSLGMNVPEQALKEPGHLNKVLLQLATRPDYAVLAVSVLRSLSQAVYQPANIGHYGLGLTKYAHFTSPIRRYPDLIVHRGIGHLIAGGKPGAFAYDADAMEQKGRSCSKQERRAEEATRYVEARLKCAYMEQHIGAELSGVITGITHFGLFVMIDELFIDGLVHVTSIGSDYYHADPGGTSMTGERTGQQYVLGQPVQVKVLSVDIDQAKVDFELVDEASPIQNKQSQKPSQKQSSLRNNKPDQPRKKRRNKQRRK